MSKLEAAIDALSAAIDRLDHIVEHRAIRPNGDESDRDPSLIEAEERLNHLIMRLQSVLEH